VLGQFGVPGVWHGVVTLGQICVPGVGGQAGVRQMMTLGQVSPVGHCGVPGVQAGAAAEGVHCGVPGEVHGHNGVPGVWQGGYPGVGAHCGVPGVLPPGLGQRGVPSVGRTGTAGIWPARKSFCILPSRNFDLSWPTPTAACVTTASRSIHTRLPPSGDCSLSSG